MNGNTSRTPTGCGNSRSTSIRRLVCVTLLLPALLVATACAPRPGTLLSYQSMNARTPKEHAAVAAAYRERAEALRREAAQHTGLAEWWSSLAGGKARATGTGRYEEPEHCRRLAANLSAAAAEADALTEAHHRLAQGSSR